MLSYGRMALVTIIMNIYMYIFNIFLSRLIIKAVSVSIIFVIVFPCLTQFTKHISPLNNLRDLLDCQV